MPRHDRTAAGRRWALRNDHDARDQDRLVVQPGRAVQHAIGHSAKRRAIDPEAVPGLTEGRIYSGRQAVTFKLVDQVGDERQAVDWLRSERKIGKGLSIVDWKPRADSGGPFSWLFGSVASIFGVPVEKIASLLGEVSASLKLDGMVSLWHPPAG